MLLAIAGANALSAQAAECTVDQNASLSLSPEAFDQDMVAGWRPVASQQGCEEIAADLIAAYRTKNADTFSPLEARASYWHEGQMRAVVGQSEQAIPLLLAAVDPANPSSGFAEYAAGTVAFIRQDEDGLRAARSRLAAMPQPDWFAADARETQARYGMTMIWPPNLDVLDGLIACFGKPYGEAYSNCRPPGD